MNSTETIEGIIGSLWYHYDLRNDVLYLRRGAPTDAATYGEEADDGYIVLRLATDDSVIGMTVVGWWKRFGHGALPDSLIEFAQRVESTTRNLPLAA